ncbi:MAG: hypothetical protein AB7K52_05600 [Phycisphaerales bacterium]
MNTLLSAIVSITLAAAAIAQPPPPPDPETRARRDAIEKQVIAAFAQSPPDLEQAETLLREWIDLRPGEFVPVYNLACVLALRGNVEPAEESLLRAVELGFTDRRTIERDPNLAALRSRPVYRDLLASWAKVLDRTIDVREEQCRKGLSRDYLFDRDPDLRLAFASGFAPASFTAARTEITRLARWWEQHVLPEGQPGVVTDGHDPDPWVMVILPTRQDFRSWAARNFARRSGAMSRIGGVYDHDKKELVAGDLGPSFKHEFMHVLHWRHNQRTGQVHPIWVQEGLCSLVEDYEVRGEGPDADLVPVPSWRTNSLKRRASSARVSIEAMLKMPREKFAGNAPLANYALARATFLYLSQLGKLRAWYGAYVLSFSDDPSGKSAFESTLGKPMAQIDKDFRIWLAKLPEAPDYAEAEEDPEPENPLGHPSLPRRSPPRRP